jgi:hypothetical protein
VAAVFGNVWEAALRVSSRFGGQAPSELVAAGSGLSTQVGHVRRHEPGLGSDRDRRHVSDVCKASRRGCT